MPHPAALSDEELLRDCDVTFLRRSGPGGQHRNKVETAVRLRHRPTGIEAEAGERRSQAENRSAALRRLRIKLALESPRVAARGLERPAVPSELWSSRCTNRKIVVSADHADFPAILAEALDVLAGCGFELRPAAEQLQISGSQLVKLLKKEPAALEVVNRRREQAGLHRLR